MDDQTIQKLRESLGQFGIYGEEHNWEPASWGALYQWRPFPVDEMTDAEVLALAKSFARKPLSEEEKALVIGILEKMPVPTK